MRVSNRLSRLLREPLLHFVLLGGGLFLLYGAVTEHRVERTDRIVVGEAEISRLADQFQRTWMRPPTREELRGLAEEFVKEEVLYREALALGLDRGDLVVRRRMRQKMEFLNADLTEPESPTEAELQAFLDENPDRFRRPARMSFLQVYVRAEDDAAQAGRRIESLRARLQAESGLDPLGLGDPSLLPPVLEDVTTREAASTFGPDLAGSIADAPLGQWSGPYDSVYGLHLVRVMEREPGEVPTLDEVRPAVERDWRAERRQEARAGFYEALRERYEVEIRLPAVITAESRAVGGR